MRLVDPSKAPYLRWLLYGLPGSTKSRTVATAALDDRTYPCLFLEQAGNPVSFREYSRLPHVYSIESLEEYNPIYNWLAAGQPLSHPLVKEYGLTPPYKSLVIDNITEVQRFSMHIVTGSTDQGPGSFSKAMDQRNFGSVLGQMVNFAHLFFSLPIHVMITCLEKRDKDEGTGNITYAPLLWGQSDTEVGGYAYLVSRMVHRAALDNRILQAVEDPGKGENIVSVALFKPSGKYVAKDQYGRLGPLMTDPTVTKVLDAIWGPSR